MLVREARASGLARLSLLVVPQWHGQEAFSRNRAFSDWLRARAAEGHEVLMHGFTHLAEWGRPGPRLASWLERRYAGRAGEFHRLSVAEARLRLGLGLDAFREADVHVSGFVAPAWLLGREAEQALREFAVPLTTRWGRVELLSCGASVRAPTLAFSSRSGWRRAVSRRWVRFWFQCHRRAPLVRFAVHPKDLMHADVRDAVRAVLRELAAARRCVTYSQVEAAWRERGAFP